MLKIHHAPMSRSSRVLWLCEEIGLEYELETITMFSDEMKTREFLSVHPMGKVPAIDDDGFVLWETPAIFQYLVAKYSDGALIPPPGTQEGARHLQWMIWAESYLTVIMGEIAAHSGPMPEKWRIPALVDRGKEMAPGLVAMAEGALVPGPRVLGEPFSAADIMLGFGLQIARHLGYCGDAAPRCEAYLAALAQRPAFQRAMAR